MFGRLVSGLVPAQCHSHFDTCATTDTALRLIPRDSLKLDLHEKLDSSAHNTFMNLLCFAWAVRML